MAHRVAPLALLASRCWRCWVSAHVVLGDAVHSRTLVASQHVVRGDAVHSRTLVASPHVVAGDAVHSRTLVASPHVVALPRRPWPSAHCGSCRAPPRRVPVSVEPHRLMWPAP